MRFFKNCPICSNHCIVFPIFYTLKRCRGSDRAILSEGKIFFFPPSHSTTPREDIKEHGDVLFVLFGP